MKHTYELYINAAKPVAKPLITSYGATKGIELHLRRSGVRIVVRTAAQKNGSDVLHGEDNLFSDLIKKAMILHLTRYSCGLVVHHAAFLIDGKVSETITCTKATQPFIYSLVGDKLRLPFSVAWRQATVERAIVTTPKSSYDTRFNALHALLIAKSDRYESERFTYYWMSMNGLYSHLASLKLRSADLSKTQRDKLNQEWRQQELFLHSYGHELCNFAAQTKEGRNLNERMVRRSAVAVLKRIPQEEIHDFCIACLNGDEQNTHMQKLRKAMKNEKLGYDYHFDIFSFMLMWLPYKLRCDSFHNDVAVPTFSFADDPSIRVLRVVNHLLDLFLTQETPRWLADAEALLPTGII